MLVHVAKTSSKECRLDFSNAEQLGDVDQAAPRDVASGCNDAETMDTSSARFDSGFKCQKRRKISQNPFTAPFSVRLPLPFPFRIDNLIFPNSAKTAQQWSVPCSDQ